jgi:hypothetical protein
VRFYRLLAFLLPLLVYWISPVGLSTDSRQTMRILLSIRDQHNLDLNEFFPQEPSPDVLYQFLCVTPTQTLWRAQIQTPCPPESRLYSLYPAVTYLLEYPVFWAFDKALTLTEPLKPLTRNLPEANPWRQLITRDYVGYQPLFERLLASLFAALSCWLFFEAAQPLTSPRIAFAATMLFAFTTTVWSTCAQALWTHTIGLCLLTATLALITRFPQRQWAHALIPILLVLLCFNRPNNVIFAAAAGLWLVFQIRPDRDLCRNWLFVPGFLVAAVLLLYHDSVFKDYLPPYYRLGGTLSFATFAEALAGHFISPSRGLFVYSPILMLAIPGAWLAFRRNYPKALIALSIGALILHTALVSSYPFWWAGHCYGPRYMTDVLPLWCLLLIPVLDAVASAGRARAALPLVLVLALTGAWIHGRAAFSYDVHGWNSAGNIDFPENHYRLWDWSRPPFLHGK